MAIDWDKPFEIRDMRNGSWFWVSKHVWQDERLSKADKIVYGTMAFFANQLGSAWPSMKNISKFSGISERQSYSSLKRLQQLKYLHKVRSGGGKKTNEYQLLKITPANFAGVEPKTTPAMIAPLQNNTPTPAKYTTPPLQNSTTNNNNINNNNLTINNIVADKPQPHEKTVKPYKRLATEKQTVVHRLVYHLEDTLHTQIISWGKQGKAITMALRAGYTEDQIKKAITYMATKDEFFVDKGFDLMTVVNQLPRYRAMVEKTRMNGGNYG